MPQMLALQLELYLSQNILLTTSVKRYIWAALWVCPQCLLSWNILPLCCRAKSFHTECVSLWNIWNLKELRVPNMLPQNLHSQRAEIRIIIMNLTFTPVFITSYHWNRSIMELIMQLM